MKMTKFAAVLAASALFANAAIAATATGTATATVLGSLTISQTQALSFGSFSSSATPGTVNHFGQTTGGVTHSGSGAQFGSFAVTGTPNTNYSIVIPATVTLTSGANSMTATLNPLTQSATNASGQGFINTTGTLAVAANQASGTYTGTYNVTVNY
jgi:hypothetical protein